MKREVRSDAHFVEDEECGERRVMISDIERNRFAVILSEIVLPRVVEKDELPLLLNVRNRSNRYIKGVNSLRACSV